MRLRLALLLCVLATTAVVVDVRPATAATDIFVTTVADVVADDGMTSLREAVDLANAVAGVDRIHLEPGQTYELSLCGPEEDANVSGDLDVLGADTTYLDTYGARAVVEQTCAGERVLDVGADGRLAVASLTITGGSGSGHDGVAIAVGDGALFAMYDSVVTGNHTTGANSSPSGIVLGRGSSGIWLTSTQVVDNGGATAVATSGSAHLDRALVSRNVNEEGAAGGLFGQVDATDSEISYNEAGDFGGGQVYGDLDGVTVAHNSGERAGGLIGGGTIVDSRINDNDASVIGGGLTGIWEVRRTSILDNSAPFFGGALLNDSTIEDSTIAGNQADAGGGLGYADVTVRRSTITENSAQRGAGALPADPTTGPYPGFLAKLTLEESTVAGNDATGGPELASEISMYRGPTPPAWTVEVVATRSVMGDGSLPVCEREGGVARSTGYTYWADTSCGAPAAAGDIYDEGGARLGPLADNGGSTETRLPEPGSPLRDRIPISDTSCAGVDQRGVARPGGFGCDIGAVETTIEPARFTSMSPVRVLDTRFGPTPAGWSSGQELTAARRLEVVLAGANGIPADATGVVLNVTSTQSTTDEAFVAVWPTGQPVPGTSVLNLQPGANVANSTTIAPGVGGKVSFMTNTGSTHLVVDVMGYYSPGGVDRGGGSGGGRRILDTRTELVPPGRTAGAKLQGGQTLRLPLEYPDGLHAVLLNITTTEATDADAFVTAWPSGEPRPEVSNLNLQTAFNVSNSAVVKLGAGGAINLYTNVGATHLIVDLMYGYGPGGIGTFVPINPVRIYDSRSGEPHGTSTVPVKIAGIHGIPSDAKGVVMNATATQSTSPSGFLTAWLFGLPFPSPVTSNLNYRPPYNTAHELQIMPGYQQQMAVYSGGVGTTHLVLDATGYFVLDP